MNLDNEPPRSCSNCMFYEERTCGMVCGILESEYSDTAIGDMTDEDYMNAVGKDPDDCCPDHEFWED